MIAMVGIDIGKNSFHISAWTIAAQFGRATKEAQFANLPACLIGMEACVGAHQRSRRLQKLGHDARLMPAR
jgi:transposase